jgi:hypothetical protein
MMTMNKYFGGDCGRNSHERAVKFNISTERVTDELISAGK